ncbi:hypothetical protein BASA81_003128 [Batrachochytrium salamandrivorans]|nr:hypothetical protein BASA81_003128 [Batrachochytrium salamandrivorans]
MLGVNPPSSIQALDSFKTIHLHPATGAAAAPVAGPISPNHIIATPELLRKKPLLAKLASQAAANKLPTPANSDESLTALEDEVEGGAMVERLGESLPPTIEATRTPARSSHGVSFAEDVDSSSLGGGRRKASSIKPVNPAVEQGKLRRASRKSIKWAPEEALVSEVAVKQTHHQIVAAEIERQERRKSLFSCCFGKPTSSSKPQQQQHQEYYV